MAEGRKIRKVIIRGSWGNRTAANTEILDRETGERVGGLIAKPKPAGSGDKENAGNTA